MGRYQVVIADNFHYMDRDEFVSHRCFKNGDAAAAAAMAIVDEWLHDALLQGVEPANLYETYQAFGDDPFILALDGSPDVEFSAWDYAKERCNQLKASLHAEAQ